MSSSQSQTLHPDEPLYRRFTEKADWDTLRAQVELVTRRLVLRYPRPSSEQIEKLVRESIGVVVDERDAYFRKALRKVNANISNWKYETIEAMLEFVKKALEAQPMLRSIRDDMLLEEFQKTYDIHDAETVFSHFAARYQITYAPGSPQYVWIKDFFCNLAVMAKLHLDKPHSEEAERAVLMDFYDMFGKIEQDVIDEAGETQTITTDDPHYARVKLHLFKPKATKKPRNKRKQIKRRQPFGKSSFEDEIPV